MPKKIMINVTNPEFVTLVTELVKGLRAQDSLHINHVKTLFEEASIHVGYNSESDKIELLEEGRRPVVLDAKEFDVKPVAPAPKA